MPITLSTIDEALAFLVREDVAEMAASEVQFDGDLTIFEAYFEGKNYNSSIPSALARGLWEFQEEIYRAVAFAIYGEDSMRRLTDEQKEIFELVFKVSQGSAKLEAPLKEFVKKLGEGFVTMDSKHKAPTLVAIVLILALAWGGTHVVDVWAEVKQKEIAANTEIRQNEIDSGTDVKQKEIDAQNRAAEEAARGEQLKLISDITKQSMVVARFDRATEEGVRAIIKGAADATKIRVGKTSFNKDEISEVNQRAARERAEPRVLSGDFYVVRIEFRNIESTRIWVASKDYDEFPVTILASDLDVTDVDRLIEAAKNRQPIKMEVNVTLIKQQVRAASIVQLL